MKKSDLQAPRGKVASGSAVKRIGVVGNEYRGIGGSVKKEVRPGTGTPPACSAPTPPRRVISARAAGRPDSGIMIREALLGAAAGTLGTAAMTIFMKPGLVGRLPPAFRPDQFVPRQVVQWLEVTAGHPYALPENVEKGASGLAHLGYGATMGALYALGPGRFARSSPVALGAAWGVAVWAAGYQGWMPAAGVRPATTHQPPTKWPVPIGNHLVFGMVTALIHASLSDRGRRRRAKFRPGKQRGGR
jgi:hypothetical protein